MCGRYTIVTKAEEIKARFNVDVPDVYKPRYNAAPTQILPVITNEHPEGLSFFHWGLIPSWSKNKSVSQKLINARMETLQEKATFKYALQKRRCLIPADGFYEWKASGKKTKIPYRIQLTNSELFSFAGLWEEYEDDNGENVHTFTIITTAANTTLSKIHDRMPVIMTQENEKIWLDDKASNDDHMKILLPYDADKMVMHPVSPKVNNVNNDNPELIIPTPPADQFGNYTLFD